MNRPFKPVPITELQPDCSSSKRSRTSSGCQHVLVLGMSNRKAQLTEEKRPLQKERFCEPISRHCGQTRKKCGGLTIKPLPDT